MSTTPSSRRQHNNEFIARERVQLIVQENDRLQQEVKALLKDKQELLKYIQQLKSSFRGASPKIVSPRGANNNNNNPRNRTPEKKGIEQVSVSHTTLMEQLTKTEQLKERKEFLMSDNTRLFNINRNLERECEAGRVDIGRLREENTFLRTELNTATHQLATMQRSVVSFEAHSAEVNKLVNTIKAQRQSTSKYAAQCARLAGEMRVIQQQMETVSHNLHQAMNQNNYLRTQIEVREREHREVDILRLQPFPLDPELLARVRVLEAENQEKNLIISALKQKVQASDKHKDRRARAQKLQEQLRVEKQLNRQLHEKQEKDGVESQIRRMRDLNNAKIILQEENVGLKKQMREKEHQILQLENMVEVAKKNNNSDLAVYSEEQLQV